MATIKIPEFKGFITEIEIRNEHPSIALEEIKIALQDYRVVKIIPGWHISDLRSFYNVITDSIGLPVNIAEDYSLKGAQTNEQWMEVRYDKDIPDLVAYRHSKNGQPLHTDESYISNPCDVMVFYCVNRAISGGETNFVDGIRLIEKMKMIDPQLLERLIKTDVTYEKAGNYRTEKIIDLKDPELPKFNFNYYCLSPDANEEESQLNQDFFDFLERNIRGSYLEHNVRLNPGEGVLWWDHFLLHGRTPFEAHETNDRIIWKTGVQWRD